VALLLAKRGEARGDGELAELAERNGVPVHRVEPEELARRAPGLRHQGVLLETSSLPRTEVDQLLKAPHPGLLVALDGVEDPQNLGAVLRVADGAGVDGVLLPQRRSASLAGAVTRTSAGALEHLPIARPANLIRALRAARDAGFWVVGTAADAELSLFDAAAARILREPVLLVFGGEGKGIRPGVRKALDTALSIPMRGQVGSLNVATAAAATLFETVRLRMG
jgi:23S rRNA (guanosine2251-2'-O)-methyltransferase